ncbi:hypothetical protein CHS0354_030241 [Potamilus streckersoni]|uniref:Uncharacterized protein n=1 Tax=Potamilus streckersoni TaxID=2493646 RepID=A0AAE0VHT8_9BIVA|nr:hypothetical protein CHS0354_030241 [Potamilus streckersoni]
MYIRRHVSNTKTKTPSKGTHRSKSSSGILTTEKEIKSFSSSIGRNENCNLTSEAAYYNVQAEYATVVNKIQPQNHSQHISASADECVYSLAGSITDTDFTIISHAVKIEGINRENVNTENNCQYDTVYEMRKPLSDSTYNHTNEVQIDAYASTVPSVIRSLDETYSQLECKSALDNIYNNTNVTDENTQNTLIKSSDQDFDHIYNNTVVD